VKKLLIIQQDEAYFLFETIQVLEKNKKALKDFELTVLVNDKSLKLVANDSTPLITGLITDPGKISGNHFDVSVNLSLNEQSWEFHTNISADKKIGPYHKDGQTFVDDLWSSYLMTLKAKAPFLTFHLQDVYRNILGIQSVAVPKNERTTIRQIAFGATAVHLYPAQEQESLIEELALSFPNFPLKDISEIDLMSDLSQCLYVGPLNLEALKFCEAGGKGIFLASGFQGFNLLPYDQDHLFLSSRGESFKTSMLYPFIEKIILGHTDHKIEYSIYSVEHENVFGAYLKSHNVSDDTYPFYQSHVVLWNFLLNLFDTDLEVTKCNSQQLALLKTQQEVLTKYIRLHDYAMVSIDAIYHQAKAKLADAAKIEGHLKNLIEIDQLSDQISQSHSLLRPVLDFYRIRRGQNHGSTLVDQSQTSFLAYSEEHQALQALNELISVTLKRNEVNI
jgi:hypothetical protein